MAETEFLTCNVELLPLQEQNHIRQESVGGRMEKGMHDPWQYSTLTTSSFRATGNIYMDVLLAHWR